MARRVRQLGSSGGGNHFVEFGKMSLQAGNVLGVPEGTTWLCCPIPVRVVWVLPLPNTIVCWHATSAVCLARLSTLPGWGWIRKNGQEYWLSMNLAGDYARACHERIHLNLSKALGLKPFGQCEQSPQFCMERGNRSRTDSHCAS